VTLLAWEFDACRSREGNPQKWESFFRVVSQLPSPHCSRLLTADLCFRACKVVCKVVCTVASITHELRLIKCRQERLLSGKGANDHKSKKTETT
jgi:hypothetical protein